METKVHVYEGPIENIYLTVGACGYNKHTGTHKCKNYGLAMVNVNCMFTDTIPPLNTSQVFTGGNKPFALQSVICA